MISCIIESFDIFCKHLLIIVIISVYNKELTKLYKYIKNFKKIIAMLLKIEFSLEVNSIKFPNKRLIVYICNFLLSPIWSYQNVSGQDNTLLDHNKESKRLPVS